LKPFYSSKLLLLLSLMVLQHFIGPLLQFLDPIHSSTGEQTVARPLYTHRMTKVKLKTENKTIANIMINGSAALYWATFPVS
jgi:hypothetical protein